MQESNVITRETIKRARSRVLSAIVTLEESESAGIEAQEEACRSLVRALDDLDEMASAFSPRPITKPEAA
jgi:hypothetical protein